MRVRVPGVDAACVEELAEKAAIAATGGNVIHVYKEALCLMKYADEHGNSELVWNSRDGVTPFIIHLRNGNEAQHVEWQRDSYQPHRVPHIGDRIFVNLTMDRAREMAARVVERDWDDAGTSGDGSIKWEPMSKRHASKEQAITDIAKGLYEYGDPGKGPDLVEVTPELQRPFVERANIASLGRRSNLQGGSGRFA